mmetsp:Transcript_72417/g.115486  ORF Transcript_72417/g.115486 Transcript_72417/m.115486 type:complete len:263 (-) Transcript_72417:479-1267(-)
MVRADEIRLAQRRAVSEQYLPHHTVAVERPERGSATLPRHQLLPTTEQIQHAFSRRTRSAVHSLYDDGRRSTAPRASSRRTLGDEHGAHFGGAALHKLQYFAAPLFEDVLSAQNSDNNCVDPTSSSTASSSALAVAVGDTAREREPFIAAIAALQLCHFCAFIKRSGAMVRRRSTATATAESTTWTHVQRRAAVLPHCEYAEDGVQLDDDADLHSGEHVEKVPRDAEPAHGDRRGERSAQQQVLGHDSHIAGDGEPRRRAIL